MKKRGRPSLPKSQQRHRMNITMSHQIAAELRAYCLRNDVTMSSLIEYLIAVHIKKHG